MKNDKQSLGLDEGSSVSVSISGQKDIRRLLQAGGIFVSAVQLTRTPMLVTDATIPGNPIVFANDKYLSFFGYSLEEIVGQDEFFLSTNKNSEETVRLFRATLAKNHEQNFHIALRHKDGTESTSSMLVMPILDKEGELIHHLMSFLDQSELIASNNVVETLLVENARLVKVLAERELHIAESNHRIKNNLMQASMILKLEERRLRHPDLVEAISATRARLDAIAGIHAMLTNTGRADEVDLAGYLEALAPQIIPATSHVDMFTEMEAGIVVSTAVAQSVALITIELVANAVKHAFPRHRAGSIRVELARTSDVIKLTVSDDGIGMADGVVESIGYQVVRALVAQHEGSLTLSSDAHGTAIDVMVAHEERNRKNASLV
jgi:PAS domain S-box-containing protein